MCDKIDTKYVLQEYRELLADANTELILTKAHNTQLQCIIRNKDNEIQELKNQVEYLKKSAGDCNG